MASTTNRVQSLLSRTRELVKPSLSEASDLIQDHSPEITNSPPELDGRLHETSNVIAHLTIPEMDEFEDQSPHTRPDAEASLYSHSPKISKPRFLAKSIERPVAHFDFDTSIDELRQSHAKTYSQVTTNLRKDQQLLDRIGTKLKRMKVQGPTEDYG